MSSIELRGVSKSFANMVGVERLDLAIRDQEFMVFLGPSGCGKTTTMRMIAGLIEPTTGDVLIDGVRVNGMEPRDRDVAMVFQSYALYPNMTVYDNIRFPLRMRGVPASQHDKLVREAAEMVQLGQYLKAKPKMLSGGQRQRAALARATVRHPKAFLMDEPLSNLDAKLRTLMRAELKRIQQQLQVTTVYVTHDQIEAMTLADRVAVLDQGRLLQLGTPDEIYNWPDNRFVAGFVGSPPMNLIRGEVEAGVFSSEGCRIPVPAALGTRDVVLGIRPEDLRPTDPSAPDHHVSGRLFGIEATGDQTLLSVGLGDAIVMVKTDRGFREALDRPVAFVGDLSRLHFFDVQTGQRITEVGDVAG